MIKEYAGIPWNSNKNANFLVVYHTFDSSENTYNLNIKGICALVQKKGKVYTFCILILAIIY
jgi:hypothetical protein